MVASAILLAPSFADAHQAHTRTEPWDVCADAELGDDCQWEDSEHLLYIGTCREVSEALMCVRHRPIVRPEEVSPGLEE